MLKMILFAKGRISEVLREHFGLVSAVFRQCFGSTLVVLRDSGAFWRAVETANLISHPLDRPFPRTGRCKNKPERAVRGSLGPESACPCGPTWNWPLWSCEPLGRKRTASPSISSSKSAGLSILMPLKCENTLEALLERSTIQFTLF